MATTLRALAVTFFLAAACQASRLQSGGAEVTAAGAGAANDGKLLFQQSVADKINSLSPGWTAGFDKSQETRTLRSFQKILGSRPRAAVGGEVTDALQTRRRHRKHAVSIPAHFDSREQWPHCRTLFEIRDQGHCGSCWAFGAVEVLSDRFCIHGHENVSLSSNDLVSCCGFQCGDGCDGGYPYKAWKYFVRKGVVSEQCQPYFDQVGCKHPGCEPVYPTPTCSHRCSGDDELWGGSKHYAENAYYVAPEVEDIQAEILERGPVEVAFTVYEDFAYYQSGVYKHVYGDEAGGHAVKLIGWGTTEDGTDYWVIANSWNKSWGEDGYFRIVRGVDECGIESEVVAGMPLLKGRRIATVLGAAASASG